MSELEELYSQIGMGQNLQEITHRILEIYQNPQSIFEVLRIISNCQNPIVKQQASIQLRKSIEISWPQIRENPIIEDIKSAILTCLTKDQIMFLRIQIIHAMSFILEEKVPWPQLGDFVQFLFQSNTPISIQTAFKILTILIPSYNDEALFQLLPTLSEKIIMAISMNSIEIQSAAYELFTQFFTRFKSPLEEPFIGILNNLIQFYHLLMVQNNPAVYEIASYVERIIKNSQNDFGVIVDLNYLIPIFLNFAMEDQISIEFHFSIFSQLIAISDECELYILKPHLEEILKVSIFCIARSLNDECYDENSSGKYIVELVGNLIRFMNNEKLYALATSLLNDESVNMSFASAVIYNLFIEEAAMTAIRHSAEILMHLLKYSTAQSPHTLYEVSLVALGKMATLAENKISAFYEPMMQACIVALNSNHPTMIINALESLNSIIYSMDFNVSYLEELINKVVELSAEINLVPFTIPVISSLIFKAKKSIIPYIPNFLNIIVQAAQIHENVNPTLKGDAIEALALLITNAPDESASIIGPSIQLFTETTNSEDLSIINKLLYSFGFLVKAKFNGIEQLLPNILQFAIAQMEAEKFQSVIISDPFDPFDEENAEINDSINDLLSNAIYIIDEISRVAPNLLAPNVNDISNQMLGFTVFPSPEIVRRALSALSNMIIVFNLDPNEYLGALIMDDKFNSNLLESENFLQVSYMFTFCKNIIKKVQIPISNDFLVALYKNALLAIEHKLPCFDNPGDPNNAYKDDDEEGEDIDENFDVDLNEESQIDIIESVFKYLSFFLRKYTVFFGTEVLAKFIDLLRRSQKKQFITEVMYGSDILGQLFELNSSLFTGLYLKFSLDIIKNCLPLCDASICPCALNAIRRIIMTNASVLGSSLPGIVENTFNILSMENVGQPFYSETIVNAVSVLFALLRIQMNQFPVTEYLPAMLNALPSKFNADFIYGSLVFIFNTARPMLEPFFNQLFRIFAQTLSLNDDVLKKYALSNDVFLNLVRIMASFMSSVPNANEVVQQFVPDPNSQQILAFRLSHPQ